MAENVVSLIVLIAVGVMLADMLIPSHWNGTKAVWNGFGTMWQITTNALLGQPTKQTYPIIP